jgi:hypothetical protein
MRRQVPFRLIAVVALILALGIGALLWQPFRVAGDDSGVANPTIRKTLGAFTEARALYSPHPLPSALGSTQYTRVLRLTRAHS